MNTLLLAMLRGVLHKDVWETNKSALSSDVLTNTDVKTLVSYIGELHEERAGDVPVQALRLSIEAKYRRPDGRKSELLDLVNLIEGTEDLPFEEIQPRIAEFLGGELAVQAAAYIGSHVDDGQLDLRRPYDLLERALELASGMDLGVEDMATAPPPDAAQERKGVATVGLGPDMDRHLGGGQGNGEMLIWLAPPGVGKTSLLISQGVEMAKAGEDVLHVTLEIAKHKCRQRVDQKLTGLTSAERLGRPGIVVEARRKLKGKFYIKDWSASNVTVDDLRALVLNMRARGESVTVLSVDYMELLVPVKNNRNGERFNYARIARDLRRLAAELDVKVITAWQVNRAGADKHVLGGIDVSECWDVVKHADIILGLNQNAMELENHVLRVNVIKQRESTARPMEYYYSDLDRMILREKGQGSDDGEPQEVGAGN